MTGPRSNTPWFEELGSAREIARNAWNAVSNYYRGDYEVVHKAEGPATTADHEANAFILDELRRRFPGDGFLSEEEEDNRDRFQRERVWIVDPIDGTNDFIQKRGNFAVQIGLAKRGSDAEYRSVLGVVYHPVPDLLYYSSRGGGAWVETPDGNSNRIHVTDSTEMEDMTVVATRSHRSPKFLELLDRLNPREVVTMGSLGLKVIEVAAGRADYYLNNARGRCSEWDVCAPEAILTEAGGTATDLEGRPFRYNREDVRIPGGVLVSNGRLHEALRRRILELEQAVKRESMEEK